MNVIERWLSVEEISNHVGVSKETIYRWLDQRDSNNIPSLKVGRLWKFKATEIDDWLRSDGACEESKN